MALELAVACGLDSRMADRATALACSHGAGNIRNGAPVMATVEETDEPAHTVDATPPRAQDERLDRSRVIPEHRRASTPNERETAPGDARRSQRARGVTPEHWPGRRLKESVGWPRTSVPGPTEALGYPPCFLGGGFPPPKLFGFCGLHAVPGPGKPPFKADGSKSPSLTSCPKFCVRPPGPLCEPSG